MNMGRFCRPAVTLPFKYSATPMIAAMRNIATTHTKAVVGLMTAYFFFGCSNALTAIASS